MKMLVPAPRTRARPAFHLGSYPKELEAVVQEDLRRAQETCVHERIVYSGRIIADKGKVSRKAGVRSTGVGLVVRKADVRSTGVELLHVRTTSVRRTWDSLNVGPAPVRRAREPSQRRLADAVGVRRPWCQRLHLVHESYGGCLSQSTQSSRA